MAPANPGMRGLQALRAQQRFLPHTELVALPDAGQGLCEWATSGQFPFVGANPPAPG